MKVNENIFREYDIRGKVDIDLSPEIALLLGKGFGTFLVKRGARKIVAGRDCRKTSPEYQKQLINGLTSTGLNVINIGEVTTPMMSFAVKTMLDNDEDGGIAVTASHNPPADNGFKLKTKGYPVWGKLIQEIKDIILKSDFHVASSPGKEEIVDISQKYIDYALRDIMIEKPLKVVLDAGNGTAGPVAPKVIRGLGCEVVELYCNPDGTFPNHIADPTVAKNMADLQRVVKEQKADIGIGYDGDGDRVGAVDENGEIMANDLLLLLFAEEILKNPDNNKNVVFDVKCSLALIQELERHGGIPQIWKTGYPNILDKMKETGALLGGEMSGHVIFKDRYLGFDDGIYASARLLEILANKGCKASDLFTGIPKFFSTPEIRLETGADEVKWQIMKDMKDYLASQGKIIDVDGYRLAFDDGWGLLRASNTQPAIVLRFEARTEERLNQIRDIFYSKLKNYSSIQWESSH